MSRESLIAISRLIVVVVYIASLLAMALGNFFITLITVSGGVIVWLLYLLAAGLGYGQGEGETKVTLGKTLSKVVAGLGGVLAASAFITYGMEQTIWGGYAFNAEGIALALAVLWVTLMPLVILQLLSKPRAPAVPWPEGPEAALSETEQPRSATALPEQQLYYAPPYPEEPDANSPEEYIEYDEDGEEREGEEEEGEDEEGEDEEGDEDYYEDEDSSEYEGEDEDEDEDEDEEDEEDEEDDEDVR